uniref:Uncharacterized protein n=1 Tax=Odontella aurita TaxID=265563 RepID=A0A7S4IW68_9STRA|mmetsp:Transcript_31188/g.93514  ORF Transcript_31188/g.93514 Transcript_31188/m.93514 type:complete len:274 (+) Transcript_31188:182-1003(+)
MWRQFSCFPPSFLSSSLLHTLFYAYEYTSAFSSFFAPSPLAISLCLCALYYYVIGVCPPSFRSLSPKKRLIRSPSSISAPLYSAADYPVGYDPYNPRGHRRREGEEETYRWRKRKRKRVRCDDGYFCNGPETCIDGTCQDDAILPASMTASTAPSTATGSRIRARRTICDGNIPLSDGLCKGVSASSPPTVAPSSVTPASRATSTTDINCMNCVRPTATPGLRERPGMGTAVAAGGSPMLRAGRIQAVHSVVRHDRRVQPHQCVLRGQCRGLQ